MKLKIKHNVPVQFRDKVKATQVYKGLGKIQKSIYTTGQNMRPLENSFQLIKNVGLERWKQVAQNSNVNSQIIQELYTLELAVSAEVLTSKSA